MLTEPLPRTLDVRKAAARGVSVSGSLEPRQMQRFRALVASDDGEIDVNLTFSRDEENRFLVRVVITAEVVLTCQRCLEAMSSRLSIDNTLAIVFTDEQAALLPRYLDPLVIPGEEGDLWELVEEELILALPSFSYHDTAACREKLAGYAGAPPVEPTEDRRPNPFDVLARLKPGKEH